jgi:hypothetical protein
MSADIITGSPGYQEMPLSDLKEGIRSENTKARGMARKSLEHVRTCGEMLIAMKARVEHGLWLFELRNIGIERKTASNYMRVAMNWGTVSHLNHGVKDALKLLTRADDPPSPAPTPSAPAPLVIEAEIVEPKAQVSPPAAAINNDALFQQGLDSLQKSLPEKQYHDLLEHALVIEEPEPVALETSPATERELLTGAEIRIEDGISKLKADGMILPTILVMLPHLTKSEIKSLIETLNTRWT